MFSLSELIKNANSSQDTPLNKPVLQLLSSIEKKSSYAKVDKTGLLHIEVEKHLNGLYPLASIQTQPFNIVLTSKASDGFGDVIWGIRTIKALQAILPNAHFSIISDALNKFELFIPPSSNITLIYADNHASFHPDLDFPDKNNGKAALEACDLAIDGPYLWNIEALSKIYNVDVQKLVEENRYICGLEYDCDRYWSGWAKQVTTASFISGLGDNAYGIFIIDELKMLSLRNTPLSRVERAGYIQELENAALKKTLNHLDSQGDCPVYFGYGEKLPAKFLEIVSRFEDKSASTQDVIIILNSRDSEALNKFLHVLKDKPLENVSSIVSIVDQYPKSDEQLESMLIKGKAEYPSWDCTSWLDDAKKEQNALRAKIPAGENCLTHTQELINFPNAGKKIVVLKQGGLTQTDMMAIYKFTQPITMVTGDQSLSEGISANKHILYDPRKEDTVQWIIEIAKRNELMLAAELYVMCLSIGTVNVDRVVEILSDPEYARQNDMLSTLCQQQDLGKALQHMVCRRLFTNQHPDLKAREDEIHAQVETVFSSDTPDSSKAQLVQQLLEGNRVLLTEIKQCNPLTQAQNQIRQTLKSMQEPDDGSFSPKL